MNTSELLEQGHVMVLQAVDDLPEAEWDRPGACGEWSVKEVIAHLAADEQLLLDVLTAANEGKAPPAYLRQVQADLNAFDKQEVEKRQYHTAQQVLNEYNDAQVQVTSLISTFPKDKLERKGAISWLKEDHSLADFVRGMSEHMNRHSLQIMQFREQLKQSGQGQA